MTMEDRWTLGKKRSWTVGERKKGEKTVFGQVAKKIKRSKKKRFKKREKNG